MWLIEGNLGLEIIIRCDMVSYFILFDLVIILFIIILLFILFYIK